MYPANASCNRPERIAGKSIAHTVPAVPGKDMVNGMGDTHTLGQ